MISDVPLSFEVMDINFGFIMYETTLSENQTCKMNLILNTIRDRAIVYLDQVIYTGDNFKTSVHKNVILDASRYHE